MLHAFDTIEDAINAGYVKAGVTHGSYRDFTLFCCAVGCPPRSDRYRIGMICENGTEYMDGGTPYFGNTVQVWTNNINKCGQPGRMYVMYTPQEYADAIEQAHAWIDAQYAKTECMTGDY